MGGQAEQAKGQDRSDASHDDIVARRWADLVTALPAMLLGGLLLASVWWDSAFDLRYWAPMTIVALALLLSQTLAGGLPLPRRGAPAVALAGVWCLAGFILLSAAWSESPAEAWEGGARAIFYAAVYTSALVAGRTPWARRLGVVAITAVALLGLVSLLAILIDGAGAFFAGRLNVPAGYRNGTAALFAFSVWPLIGAAARRNLTPALRAAAFAGAVLLLGLAFLTQSRGVLLGLGAGAVVSLLIGPDRLRRAWLALGAVGAVAIVSGALLDPFHAFDSGAGSVADADAESAGLALLLAPLAAFVGGLALALLDNGLRLGERGRARAAAVARAGLAVLAVLACVVAIARVGDPISYADEKLDEFTTLESGTADDGTRLGTVSGQRYDLYRIAWEQFAAQPLAGAGEGSYPVAYYLDRRTDRNLDNPHSLPLRLLSQTGLVGLALFVAWLLGTGVAIARGARHADPGARLWLGGLAAAGATVVFQSFVDWLWLLPGLFGLAVLALGLAAGETDDPEPAAVRGQGAAPPRLSPWRALGALGLAAALVSVALLFLSDLYVRKARAEAGSSPAAALTAARTAESLDPVSPTPLYLQASALETMGRRAEAREALLEALELEPRNFVTLALLGDFEARSGRVRRALGYYRDSLKLNPRDVGLRRLSEGPTRLELEG